jgi:hypothetical protein
MIAQLSESDELCHIINASIKTTKPRHGWPTPKETSIHDSQSTIPNSP